jgi:F-type H+-transporting ATPase subunit b
MVRTAHKSLSPLIFALISLSPQLAWAGGGGHGFPWADLVVSFLNFAIFLGILVKFGGPVISEHFQARRKQLVDNLEEASRLREAAQKKLDELTSKVDALDTERDTLLKEYRAQGERERDKLVDEAKRQIEKMRLDAEKAITQETKKAIQTLERRAVARAVEMAESEAREKLKTKAAQDALVDGFVSDLSNLAIFQKRAS